MVLRMIVGPAASWPRSDSSTRGPGAGAGTSSVTPMTLVRHSGPEVEARDRSK